MDKSIDLGQSYEACCPSPMKEGEKTKHYPSFHYEGDTSLDLPKEGSMEISYKVTSEANSENRDGKKHYSCTIEVISIDEVESEDEEDISPAHGADKSVSDLLDGLMKAHMAKNDKAKEGY